MLQPICSKRRASLTSMIRRSEYVIFNAPCCEVSNSMTRPFISKAIGSSTAFNCDSTSCCQSWNVRWRASLSSCRTFLHDELTLPAPGKSRRKPTSGRAARSALARRCSIHIIRRACWLSPRPAGNCSGSKISNSCIIRSNNSPNSVSKRSRSFVKASLMFFRSNVSWYRWKTRTACTGFDFSVKSSFLSLSATFDCTGTMRFSYSASASFHLGTVYAL
mmetsp:Transcript_1613/g.4770  ORF Transcript_1613/g.4770 Transcript_1613/m.4770 type:complete len:219 (-) Transcript_1613:1172-1828(-)